MDARDQLRRYLEQRRELGERELVLDDMSVEEVMRLLGAGAGTDTRAPENARPRPDPAPTGNAAPPPDSADWREVLRATGGAPTPPVRRSVPEPVDPPRERRVEEDTPAPVPAQARSNASPEATTPQPPQPPQPPQAPQPPASKPPEAASAPGLVVGGAGRELFGGPFSDVESIEALRSIIATCTRCPLYKTATNAVPGEGNPNAELVCVGEAPGQTEDETGRPFVGAAGQLLTKILAAINLRREDVFICNVLKHRPPGNRNPMPLEVTACSPYLVRQLELIRPKVIVAFGTFAAQTLLDTKLALGKLRGTVHRYHGIPLVVTYHPAALLRNPAWKRPTWEDVQLARRVLDSATGA